MAHRRHTNNFGFPRGLAMLFFEDGCEPFDCLISRLSDSASSLIRSQRDFARPDRVQHDTSSEKKVSLVVSSAAPLFEASVGERRAIAAREVEPLRSLPQDTVRSSILRLGYRKGVIRRDLQNTRYAANASYLSRAAPRTHRLSPSLSDLLDVL